MTPHSLSTLSDMIGKPLMGKPRMRLQEERIKNMVLMRWTRAVGRMSGWSNDRQGMGSTMKRRRVRIGPDMRIWTSTHALRPTRSGRVAVVLYTAALIQLCLRSVEARKKHAAQQRGSSVIYTQTASVRPQQASFQQCSLAEHMGECVSEHLPTPWLGHAAHAPLRLAMGRDVRRLYRRIDSLFFCGRGAGW